MTIQTDINSPEPVNLSIHGSIITPWAEGFIFKDMKGSKISVEVDGIFYESISEVSRCLKYNKITITKRCLSNKFPNYKIVPFRITYVEKRCTVCGETKLLKEFYKDNSSKNKLKPICKQCESEYKKRVYIIKREEILITTGEWRKGNREKTNIAQNKRNKNKKKTTADKLNKSMSTGINRSLKGMKNGRHWESLVDYTLEELVAYLEPMFLPGMTWENHGYGDNKWHIDHKRPISSFNITSTKCEDFIECWSLDNLQPLWQLDNLSKGAKLNWKPKSKTKKHEKRNTKK